MLLSLVLFAARAAAAADTADKSAKSPVASAPSRKAAAKTPTKVAGIRTVFLPSARTRWCAIRLYFQSGRSTIRRAKRGWRR